MYVLPTTRRGGIVLERALFRGRRGTVALRQRITGTDERAIVTHRAGLVARVEVHAGSLTFVPSGQTFRENADFVLVVPQRSIVRMRFEQAQVQTDGLGQRARV